MGLFSIFSRQRTPQELEERSRREHEIAQKYYERGQRIGRKLGLDKAVRKTNVFLNRYPITFFAVFTAVIIASLALNMMLSRVDLASDTARNIRNVSSAVGGIQADSVRLVLEGLYDEYEELNGQLTEIIGKDMTREDSVTALGIYERMTRLEEIFQEVRSGRVDLSPPEPSDSVRAGDAEAVLPDTGTD